MKIKIKRINPNATIPTRGTKDSAGYDLYACTEHNIIIQPHETVKIPIGICTEMIKNTVALVYSRSGIATKKGLVVCQGTGVIDSDYRGEWFVPIHNDTNKIQTIEPKERIAQVIFTDFIVPDFEESECLSTTERMCGGFGSTGK